MVSGYAAGDILEGELEDVGPRGYDVTDVVLRLVGAYAAVRASKTALAVGRPAVSFHSRRAVRVPSPRQPPHLDS
jgi:hypothetical protein